MDKIFRHSKRLSISILSKSADALTPCLDSQLPECADIVQSSHQVENFDKNAVQLLLADPDLAAQVIEDCPNLKWCQSTWAGNKPLLSQARRDYILTGVKDIFGQQMCEYVFAYILHFSRNIDGFTRQMSERQNRWSPPTYTTLKGKSLGILGAGSIADALLPIAKQFNMKVIGLTRSGKEKPGYDRIFSAQDKLTCAAQLDYCVSLMPDTPATTNFIDSAFLHALPNHCVLINAGRGNAVDDQALIKCVQNQQLKAAVLDVFRQEPLPDSHPFWTTPGIVVTQHTAAETLMQDIVDVYVENLNRYKSDMPLLHQFDFSKGY